MANVCSDNVFFFSDDNPDGIKALWRDLEASITPATVTILEISNGYSARKGFLRMRYPLTAPLLI